MRFSLSRYGCFGRASRTVLVCGWLLGTAVAVHAQAPNRQCGDYVEAYKGGPVAYGTYLQATADVAKSRDSQEGGNRYSAALQTSSAPSNALWLNNWCTKSPLRGFTEASSKLLDELTGQSQPANGAAALPAQVIVVTPPQPSACRVGDVGVCRGCSASCENGGQAKCKQGSTYADGSRCAFEAKCGCDFGKNAAAPPPGTTSGVSSCRIGDVGGGVCSGCSVTCNGGQSPICKPGSTTADGQSCAFQSKCSCK
jgi:hypothetical protein